jgi:hypothetical protein
MRERYFLKTTGAAVALATIVLTALFTVSRRVHADDGFGEEAKIREGFAIAPVPLNMAGKDPSLVGLGSYIVNAQADCNGCHNPGPGGASGLLKNGNPYLLPPPLGPYGGKTLDDPATYLGGGRDFGAFPAEPFPHIISRNLTPDKTGLPEGGHTFAEFLQIIKTGQDMDHIHPTCTGAPDGKCLPLPFDGSLLQVMPWPTYRTMTHRDLRAIYEYLSAIPCVAGPPAPDIRHNDCQ